MSPVLSMRKSSIFGLLHPDFHTILVQSILLCEVLYDECVSKSLCNVSYSEEEVLLISWGVGVGSHVQVVQAMRNFDCHSKITTFKVTIKLKSSGVFRLIVTRRPDQVRKYLVFGKNSIVNCLTSNVSLEWRWKFWLFKLAFAQECLDVTLLKL